MTKNQGSIKFGVQFQVDKTGLNELKTSLQQLQNLTVKDLVNISNADKANDKLNEIKKTAQKITKALEESYNVKLDTTNLSKFQKSLLDSGLSLSSIKKDFSEAGVQGQIAFRNLATELATTNNYIKQSSQWLDKMAETLSNTVRWTVASSAVNSITGSIQKAYNYTKQLDSSLNDIVIVTGKSSEEMDKFARKANDAAKALGATTTDYTKASLIYYQQGLSDSEVQARAAVTTKVANVTGTSADVASEQLTAIWNGYKVQAQEAEIYIDKVSAVAATTAADLEELATGMSKVASAANITGVDIDQLNAQLATIVSVTREAPESIGTALKTVYARMSDIKAGLDEEVTLDEYTKQMAEMGINVLDAQNKLRDMGDIVEEIGEKWVNLTREQQVSLAQTVAGTRQYSRMMALFDNWNMYQQAKETSKISAGALEEQNERYLDSMEAHLNQLSAAAEGLYDSLLDPQGLNKLIDNLTKVVELADQLVQSLGGGGGLLMNLGSIGLNVFGNQISRGISNTIRNAEGLVNNLKNANTQADLLANILDSSADDPRFKEIIATADKLREVSALITEEERQQANLLIKKSVEMLNQEDSLEDQRKSAEKLYAALTGKQIDISTKDGYEEFIKDLKSPEEAVAARFTNFDTRGFTQLDKLQKRITATRIANTRFGNLAEKSLAQDWANAPISTMQTEGVEYEQEYFEISEKTLEYQDKQKTKQEELNTLIEQQNNLLKEFYETNIKSIDLKDFKEEISTLKQLDIFDEKELQELEEARRLIKSLQKKEKDGVIIDFADFNKAEKAILRYNQAIEKAKKAVKEGANGAKDYAEKLDKIKSAQDGAKASLDKFLKSLNLNKAIDGFVNLAGGATNVLSSLNNIKNLGNIWSNETLTDGEKILQTLSNISFTVPMLVSGFKNISNGVKEVSSIVTSFIAVQRQAEIATQAYNAIQNASIEQLQNRAFWDIMAKAVKNELTEEQWKEVLAIQATEGALTEEQIAKLQSILGDGAKIGSQKALSTSITLTTKALLTQTKAFLTSPVGMILLAIAAAVAAVTIAVKLGSEAYNKYNLQMEKVLEAAEHQKQVYEDVKKAYEDLKNSINDYEDSQKAIDELTEGTEEWRDAIIEANQQITDLIQKYPQLAKYVNKDNSGRLSIQEAGLDIAEQTAFAATNQAYAQSMAATVNLNRATELANAEKISQATDYTNFGSIVEGVLKSTLPLWVISENIIKKDASAIYENETSTEDIVKIAERLNTTEGSSKTIAQLAREVLGENASVAQIEAIENNSDEIKNLAEKLEANSASSELLGEQIMSAYLSTDKNYKDSQYQGVIDEVMGDTYNALLDKYRDEYADKVGGKTDAEIQKEYADMMVATGQWQQRLSVKNKSGNKAEYTYIDANGDPQSLVIDDTVAREALAVQATMKAAGSDANIKAITDAIKTLSKTLPDEIEKAVITTEFTKGGKGDLGVLLGSEIKELEALVNTRALEVDDDKAKALGYDTAEKYYAAIEAAINDYQTRSKELAAKFADIIATDAWDALTLAQQETISEWYNSFSDGEKTAAIELLKASGKNANQVLSLIEGTKWGEQGASSNLVYQLKNLVPDLDIGLIDQFVNGLEKINSVFGKFNLNATRESYKSIDNIMSSLTETGNIISEADFKILGEQYEEYFITMADGSKKLVKDANEFYNTVYKIRASAAVDSLSDSVKALNDYYEKNRLLETTSKTALLNSTTKSIALSNDTLNTAKIETSNAVGITTGLTDIIKISDEGREALKTVAEQAKRKNLLQEGEFDQIWSDLTDNNSVWYSKTAKRLVDLINNNPDFAFAEWTEETWGENPEWVRLNEEVSRLGSEDSLKQAIKDNIDNLGVLGANIIHFEDNYSELFDSLDDEDQVKIKKAAETFKNVYDQTYNRIATDSMRKLEEQILPSLDKELETLSREFEDLQQAMELTGKITDELWTALRANIEASQNAAYNKYTGLQTQNSIFLNEDAREYFSRLGLENVVEESKLKEWLASEGSLVNSEYEIRAKLTALKTADTTGALSEIVDEFLSKYEIFLENFNTNIPVALQDYKNELIRELELNLQKFETELNDQLDITEAQKKYNEFLREIKENDFDQDASSYLSDFSSSKSNVTALITALTDLESKTRLPVEKIEAMAEQGLEIAENEISMADYREQKEEIINKLREEGLSAQEALAQATQTVVDYQNAITESYQDQVNLLENVIDSYEHLISLNELIYGDKAIHKTVDYYNKINEQNKIIMLTREKELATANSAYQRALNSSNDDLIKSAQETYIAANQAYQDSIAAYAQSAQEAFYKETEARFAAFIGDIEKYKEDWDWFKDTDEDFLDEFDKLTGISKIETAFNKKINETMNINAQKKLNELKERELKQLREKEKLTQYDLDRANKILEIEQARIALEEAQQNKVQTRLTRGLDGSYSYEYVTDQDAIDKVRTELESLQNDLVHLDEKQLESSLDQAYDLYAAFMKELEDLIKNGGTQAEIDALYSRYATRIEEILGYAFNEENGILAMMNQSIAGMNALLGTEIDISQIFEGFNSDFVSEMRKFISDGFTASLNPFVEEMKGKQNSFNEIMDGENGLLTTLNNAVIAFDQAIGDEDSGMFEKALDATTALNDLSIAIWGEDGSGGVVGAIKGFASILDDILKDIAKDTNPNPSESKKEEEIPSSPENIEIVITESSIPYSPFISDQSFSYTNGIISPVVNGAQLMPKPNWIRAFDTGGYTGEWGADGRLALLHEKELVLDKMDTINILNAVDIVRDLQFALDSSIATRMAEMIDSYNNLMQAWNAIKDQVIEQNIQINAEFPNVTEKSEIEEAFEELVNMATQRAFTSKK